ncbi:hypothetical protein [Mesorhizobium tamadayense]|uniref:hypothetical protein n=1 Tax=Mesorhizobium tamadayense TaxID=425306 RepID=UPI001FDF3665|nr:hypothetical protein [Mesorhizobium tamadayense]
MSQDAIRTAISIVINEAKPIQGEPTPKPITWSPRRVKSPTMPSPSLRSIRPPTLIMRAWTKMWIM